MASLANQLVEITVHTQQWVEGLVDNWLDRGTSR